MIKHVDFLGAIDTKSKENQQDKEEKNRGES